MSITARQQIESSGKPNGADRPPLVSIIISFLNAERFLGEAIESVFLQTYDNWELLLVDDGSTDGSARIAQRLRGCCPNKVFSFEHPGRTNLGLPRSRNLGLQKARGRYVALLDADDVWLPSKLEEQVRYPGIASRRRPGLRTFPVLEELERQCRRRPIRRRNWASRPIG